MVLMTLIARVADALPLAASMQEDEQVKLNRVKLSSSRDTHVNAIYVSGSSDLIDIFKEASGMCYCTHSNALKNVHQLQMDTIRKLTDNVNMKYVTDRSRSITAACVEKKIVKKSRGKNNKGGCHLGYRLTSSADFSFEMVYYRNLRQFIFLY